jgi:formylglycine-generating enzyme required for sulfatase activity
MSEEKSGATKFGMKEFCGRLSRRRFLNSILAGTGAFMATACRSTLVSRASGPGTLEPFTEIIRAAEAEVELLMLPIPGGTFVMADPYRNGAPREFTIQPFWMLQTELPWDAYSLFAYGHHLREGVREFAHGVDAVSRPTDPFVPPANRGWGREGEPAIRTTFHAAVKFCEWLSQQTGRKYRLPTEAEWEYACRAGESLEESVPGKLALDEIAWHSENAEGMSRPVARKAPNRWGLHDMLGNVAEWCAGLGDKPVVRGGSFMDPPEKIRPETRAYYSPSWQESDYQDPKSRWWLIDAPHVGFRVVCDL